MDTDGTPNGPERPPMPDLVRPLNHARRVPDSSVQP